jgi:hypothetical protein
VLFRVVRVIQHVMRVVRVIYATFRVVRLIRSVLYFGLFGKDGLYCN